MERNRNGIRWEWEQNGIGMGTEQEWSGNGVRTEQEQNGIRMGMEWERNGTRGNGVGWEKGRMEEENESVGNKT